MKKLTAILTVFVLICTLCIQTSYAKEFIAQISYDGAVHDYRGGYFNVLVNNKEVTSPIPPIVLESGRSIVAVREIFEAMGADVLWTQGSPSRVMICRDADIVSLALDDNIAYVNGREVEMEVPAKLVSYNNIGKTMVPVRFVAETLGMEVDFLAETSTIFINPPSSPTPVPTEAPTPTPTPTPVPTPTPIPSAAESLTYKTEGNTLTATIALSAPCGSYEDFILNSPDRVVLDIKGFDVQKLNASYNVQNGFVSQIRTGEYGGSARIVFDVSNLDGYNVKPSDDKMSLTVTIRRKNDVPDTPSGGYKVVIDAGHGGSDPGAIGYNDDGSVSLMEKEVTLPVANRVYQILRENGVDAYYTRNTDVYVTLDERTSFANKIGASLFVSIHCNALTSPDVGGTLVMHHTSKDTSEYGVSGQDLAQNILKYLPDALGTQNRGRMDGSKMYVIRKADMPSVITEMAFITNKEDRAKLADDTYREKAAQAIAKGIIDTMKKLKK